MYVVHHAHLLCQRNAGEQRFAAVDSSRGISGFEVWVVTLDPGAQTEALQHAGEMVLLATAGSGKLLIDGGPQRFSAPCTLVIPPQAEFRIVNNGSIAMQLISVFTRPPTPAATVGDTAPPAA
jgi:quercetin dioxygenase-like cupin family protein